jgi:hypothetical protein
MSMSPLNPAEPVVDRAEDAGPASPSRRRFVRNVGLGAAALGAAAATGASLTGVASAQAESEPADLDAADQELALFLQSICLAGEEGLNTASDAASLQSEVAEDIRTFSRHHGTQASAFAGLLAADEALTQANQVLLGELVTKVNGAADQAALLGVLGDFEEQLAATMLQAIGEASSFVLAGTISSVLPVVGQQAAALGAIAGQPIADWLPVVGTTQGALDAADFPVQ